MRIRLAAVVASLALLATAGCGGGSTAAKGSGSTLKPADKVTGTITFWHAYSSDSPEVSALKDTVIPAFEAKHPGVTVKQVAMPYDQLHQKLVTAAAGGNLPDLVRSDIIWVPELAKLGVLQPLDTTMSDFQSIADQTYPGALETNKYKGHYYGMPLDTNTRVLLYNNTVLAKAGVSTPPKTFADLETLAGKLDGTGDAAFADNGLSGWNVLPWIWSGGGDLTNADYTKATGYLNSDKTVAALQTLLDLYKIKQIPGTLVGNKGGVPPGDGLAKANYATILDGPWMYPIFKAQYPKFDVQAALVPSSDGHSVSVVGGENVVMTKTSKNPALAAMFIRHLLSKDSQLAMAKVGQMPVLSAVGDDLVAVQPYYATFVEQLATARPRPPVATWPKIEELLQTSLQKVFTGKAALRPTLDSTAAEIDQLLAQG